MTVAAFIVIDNVIEVFVLNFRVTDHGRWRLAGRTEDACHGWSRTSQKWLLQTLALEAVDDRFH